MYGVPKGKIDPEGAVGSQGFPPREHVWSCLSDSGGLLRADVEADAQTAFFPSSDEGWHIALRALHEHVGSRARESTSIFCILKKNKDSGKRYLGAEVVHRVPCPRTRMLFTTAPCADADHPRSIGRVLVPVCLLR